MLFGQFDHSFDDKGRLMVPSKIRSELGDCSTLYMLKGFEGCMSVYTKDHFDKLVSSLEAFSFLNKDARNFVRLTLASVIQVNIDKIGRIQFTPSTLEKYKIGKEVTVIGVNDHFEIWDKKAYKAYEQDGSAKFEDLADSLVRNNG